MFPKRLDFVRNWVGWNCKCEDDISVELGEGYFHVLHKKSSKQACMGKVLGGASCRTWTPSEVEKSQQLYEVSNVVGATSSLQPINFVPIITLPCVTFLNLKTLLSMSKLIQYFLNSSTKLDSFIRDIQLSSSVCWLHFCVDGTTRECCISDHSSLNDAAAATTHVAPAAAWYHCMAHTVTQWRHMWCPDRYFCSTLVKRSTCAWNGSYDRCQIDWLRRQTVPECGVRRATSRMTRSGDWCKRRRRVSDQLGGRRNNGLFVIKQSIQHWCINFTCEPYNWHWYLAFPLLFISCSIVQTHWSSIQCVYF